LPKSLWKLTKVTSEQLIKWMDEKTNPAKNQNGKKSELEKPISYQSSFRRLWAFLNKISKLGISLSSMLWLSMCACSFLNSRTALHALRTLFQLPFRLIFLILISLKRTVTSKRNHRFKAAGFLWTTIILFIALANLFLFLRPHKRFNRILRS